MGRPLYMKLGIHQGPIICVVNAPSNYREMIGCPFEIKWDQSPKGDTYSFLQLFAADPKELATYFPVMKERMSKSGMLWVAWPKKAEGLGSELDGKFVREYGLGQGLVDVKIVSINEDWSALKFVYRVRDRI